MNSEVSGVFMPMLLLNYLWCFQDQFNQINIIWLSSLRKHRRQRRRQILLEVVLTVPTIGQMGNCEALFIHDFFFIYCILLLLLLLGLRKYVGLLVHTFISISIGGGGRGVIPNVNTRNVNRALIGLRSFESRLLADFIVFVSTPRSRRTDDNYFPLIIHIQKFCFARFSLFWNIQCWTESIHFCFNLTFINKKICLHMATGREKTPRHSSDQRRNEPNGGKASVKKLLVMQRQNNCNS